MKRGFLFLLIFLGLSALVIFKVKKLNKNDLVDYEQLLKNAHENSLKISPFRLYRKNVVKEIWWGDEKQPLYARIECVHSELIARRGRNNSGSLEKMEGVTSFYQEKLFYQLPDGRLGYLNDEGKIVVQDGGSKIIFDSPKTLFPMQEVRYFEADSGFCSYKNWDFIGEKVTMKKYRLRGHLPPPFISLSATPLTTAEGKKMHLTLKDRAIDIQLEGLKTTFHPKDGI